MWSVVEKTALAEAEVEYHDHESDTIWCKFGVAGEAAEELSGASVVIWTTTPWTIPATGLSVTRRRLPTDVRGQRGTDENWAAAGDRLILADSLADDVKLSARIDDWTRVGDVSAKSLAETSCAHPLAGLGTSLCAVAGWRSVTDDAGTGFVHTAPGTAVTTMKSGLQTRSC